MKKKIVFSFCILVWSLLMFSGYVSAGSDGINVIVMKPYNSGATLYGYGGDDKSGSSGTSWFAMITGGMPNPVKTAGGALADTRSIDLTDFNPKGTYSIQFDSVGNNENMASSGITIWVCTSNKNTDEAWGLSGTSVIYTDINVKTGNTNYVLAFSLADIPAKTGGPGRFMRIKAESGASDITPTLLIYVQ